MADKFHSDTEEKVETISYTPYLQDTGDLEDATKTITATSEASGLVSADYNKALTLPKPDDARLVIKRIASRLAVTIDSMTAGHLHLRVYVDVQDADHKLFDEDWTTTGEKLDCKSWTSGTIFDLLKDGSAHTFYFFFWVDSGNAVISLVQLWEGVGSTGADAVGWHCEILRINHIGWVQVGIYTPRVGTGSKGVMLHCPADSPSTHTVVTYATTDSLTKKDTLILSAGNAMISFLDGTVSTDLLYVDSINVTLRSLQ